MITQPSTNWEETLEQSPLGSYLKVAGFYGEAKAFIRQAELEAYERGQEDEAIANQKDIPAQYNDGYLACLEEVEKEAQTVTRFKAESLTGEAEPLIRLTDVLSLLTSLKDKITNPK